jgi:hypothetical protein
VIGVRDDDHARDMAFNELAVHGNVIGLSRKPCFQIRAGAYPDRVHLRLRVEAYRETYALVAQDM